MQELRQIGMAKVQWSLRAKEVSQAAEIREGVRGVAVFGLTLKNQLD